VLLHLDDAQALLVEPVQHRLHERRFSGAARAGEERVVGGAPLDELPRVLLDQRFLVVDAVQVGQPDAVHIRDRLDVAAARALAPAEGDARVPVHSARRRRKQLLDALEQRLAVLDQLFQLRHAALRFCTRR
jgi:hypothetical protein